MERMKFVLEKAKFTIWNSYNKIIQYYNQQYTSTLVFCSGDKIFLDFFDIYTTYFSTKLLYCYLGPYIVEKQVRSMS